MYTTGVVKCPCCERDIIVSYDDEDGFSVEDMYKNYYNEKMYEAICEYNSSMYSDGTYKDLLSCIEANSKLQDRIKSIKTREEWLKGE